jgi:hypothetical protein
MVFEIENGKDSVLMLGASSDDLQAAVLEMGNALSSFTA